MTIERIKYSNLGKLNIVLKDVLGNFILRFTSLDGVTAAITQFESTNQNIKKYFYFFSENH